MAAFIGGAIIGSFLNAFLFRFNTGRSVVVGRSHCMRCGHTLFVPDLIPIVSFIVLRGRCRYCSTPISLQYPLVETASATLSVLVYLTYPALAGYIFWFIVSMTLLCIVVYDIRHTIIPWSFSIFLLLLAILSLFFSFENVPQFTLPTM